MSLQQPTGSFQQRTRLTRRQWVTFLGLVAIVGIASYLAISYVSRSWHKKEPGTELAVDPGLPLVRPPEPVAAAVPATAIAAPKPIDFTPPKLPNSSPEQGTFYADGDMGMGFSGGQEAAPRASGPGEFKPAGSAPDANGSDDFSKELTHSSDLGRAARATIMRHPELTIPAGTVIGCTLQTAINSQLQGLVDCLINQEVRGATGTVTLFQRGTHVLGEVRAGLQNGQDRLFVLWVRARTPENVVVTLDSPASDERGMAGVAGYVDNHFVRRWLAALAFSVIDAGPNLLNTALQNQNRGNGNTYTSFLSPQQSLANTILQKDLNIPDVLEQNQGAHESIFIARDLDFSGAYELEATR